MDVSTMRELALQISGIDTIVALSAASGTAAGSVSAEAPSSQDYSETNPAESVAP